MKPMRFIGLDISIVCTGVSILDENLEIILASNVASKKGPYLELDIPRFQDITQRLSNKVQFQEDDFVLIENYAYGASGQITRIAELTGLIKNLVYNTVNHKRIFVCSPPSLKKFVVGKGNCAKNLIMKTAYQRWGFNSNNDNEVDAYALARLCQCFVLGSETNQKEKEVCRSIAKTNGVLLDAIRRDGEEIKAARETEEQSKRSADADKKVEKERAERNLCTATKAQRRESQKEGSEEVKGSTKTKALKKRTPKIRRAG